jgi:hypothetical protein
MNVDLAQELLNELGSSIENLEKQHAALLQFLKDAGIVTDDQLTPYLTQAGKASNVRWRAARIRLERLFSTEKQKEEQFAEKESQHLAGKAQAASQGEGNEAKSKNNEDKVEAAPQSGAAVANAAKESAGAQSASEKNSEQDERATSGEKKTTPKQEANGA